MSRFTALSLSFAAAVSALAVAPAAAEAANGPNLSVSVTPPPATNVYALRRYNLTVANVGNRDALNVSVVINLPSALTSPGRLGHGHHRRPQRRLRRGRPGDDRHHKIRGGRNAPLFFDATFPLTTSSLAMPVVASSSPLRPEPGQQHRDYYAESCAPSRRDIQAAIADNAGPITPGTSTMAPAGIWCRSSSA